VARFLNLTSQVRLAVRKVGETWLPAARLATTAETITGLTRSDIGRHGDALCHTRPAKDDEENDEDEDDRISQLVSLVDLSG
jgi:hypothetical protein